MKVMFLAPNHFTCPVPNPTLPSLTKLAPHCCHKCSDVAVAMAVLKTGKGEGDLVLQVGHRNVRVF